MDIQAHLNRIAVEFGGCRKNRLLLELENLIDSICESQEEIHKPPKKINGNYVNCEHLIKNLIIDKWYHISIVPDELWIDFFNIADIKHEIIFDNERDDQFFKIV